MEERNMKCVNNLISMFAKPNRNKRQYMYYKTEKIYIRKQLFNAVRFNGRTKVCSVTVYDDAIKVSSLCLD